MAREEGKYREGKEREGEGRERIRLIGDALLQQVEITEP